MSAAPCHQRLRPHRRPSPLGRAGPDRSVPRLLTYVQMQVERAMQPNQHSGGDTHKDRTINVLVAIIFSNTRRSKASDPSADDTSTPPSPVLSKNEPIASGPVPSSLVRGGSPVGGRTSKRHQHFQPVSLVAKLVEETPPSEEISSIVAGRCKRLPDSQVLFAQERVAQLTH